jgi:probable O-glycosylation ligase (exosortase A-associated)
MRGVLLALVIFGSLPAIFVKPHIGVLVWSWFSYMNPHTYTWGFAANFRWALLIGGVTVLAWLFSREPKRIPWTPITILLLAFTLWTSFTTLFALVPDAAYEKWDQSMKIFLMTFVAMGLMIRHPYRWRRHGLGSPWRYDSCE